MNDDKVPDSGIDRDHRRLLHLEAELAFQTDAVRELNEALAAQQLDLLTLQRQVALLGEQLAALRSQVGTSGDAGAEPRPPHY